MCATQLGSAIRRDNMEAMQAPAAASSQERAYKIVEFAELPVLPCPCGTTQRAFGDVPEYPGTIHLTRISEDAQMHYHKRLTETYYFLECGPSAVMQLDGEMVPVRAGMCVMILPGVRHRAIGKMTVLNIVFPKFDPADEWMD
jgi:mannose-6-phosphate isomerase-like protein (cupin superfamily)